MTQVYNTVIVEDEPHQQARLLQLLQERCGDIQVAGVASSVEEAFDMIGQLRPRLVFLDVMLGPTTSFELLKKFSSISFEIIFTTSFEKFAVEAFRLSAVDYLIKPLVPEELEQAVQRFRDRMEKKNSSSHLQLLLDNLQAAHAQKKKIALPTLTGYIFITLDEVIRCESDNTYTTFHLKDKRKIVVSRTLKECEGMLTDYGFFRVHNSSLINLNYIVEYIKGEGGIVKMVDGSQVDVSRRRKDEFVRIFNKLGEQKLN